MSGKRRNRQSSNMPVDSNVNHHVSSTRTNSDEGDSGAHFSFNDVENLMRKYRGDGTLSVTKWIDEFERYANAFKWDSIQKYIYCKRLLCGTAKMYIECEVRPINYEEMKTALISEFMPRVSSADIHKKLQERKKKESESLREYLYVMIDLAAQANVDEPSIISYVIDGIKDSPLNKSVLYSAKTLNELKENFIIYEKVKIQNPRVEQKAVKKDIGYAEKVKKRHCYNCGSTEHLLYMCPERTRGMKCFNCGEFGTHKGSDCPRKKQPTSFMVQASKAERTLFVNGVELNGLMDTGSDICIIKSSALKVINPNIIFRNQHITITGLGSSITANGMCMADINIDDVKFHNAELYIVNDSYMRPTVLIGMNLLSKAVVQIEEGKIFLKNKHLTVDGEKGEVKTNTEAHSFLAEIEGNVFCNEDNLPDLINISGSHLGKEITSVISNYLPLQPPTSPIQMRIVPLDDKPVYKSPRRFPPHERKIIEGQVREWLSKNIIRESTSDYASQVVLVKKKDNAYRLCVDYRELNKKIHKERYPLPNIEDELDKLQKAKYFTTLDLENGFFHVNIDENSRRFTAFVTQDGQFEFNRVPFGLCNSPCVFQKYINYIFRDQIRDGVVAIYIDDIVIPAESIEEAVDKMKMVLQIAARNGLKIRWKKCQILRREIEYLGYLVKDGTVSPSLTKTKAVANFPQPTTMKQLQSFLGLASYFRKFIPNFSLMAQPLTDLLKKQNKNKFEMGMKQLEAIEKLKTFLINKPVLNLFRYGAPTELHTDASKLGLGAVLFQRAEENSSLHPVYYWSKKTSDAEKNYSSYELEVLAVVESIKRFRIYLIGQPFKLVTDCQAFKCTMQKKDLTTRVARWALLLEEFDYTVEHRSSTRMKHVDSLSRNPVTMCLSKDNSFLVKLKEAQKRDEGLNAIMELLQNEPYQDYVLNNGILCKNKDNNLLFVVPNNMKSSIIKEVHERGHFHFRKMKEIIEKEYYIPDLKKQIERHISGCVRCILAERKVGRAEGFLNPIPKGDKPLQTFHVDHVGPMQDTRKGYRYILSVIDGFTKFSWLFPTKKLNADEVIQKLEIIAETFGYPYRIISDKGGAFISRNFQEYCQRHDIKLHSITAGIPRGNGQVERLHATILPVLTKITLQDPEKWYTHVKPLQKILNSTYQRAINTTPIELLIGIPMKTGHDIRILEALEEEVAKSYNEARETLREKAKLEIGKIQAENRKQYNKKRKAARTYETGDLVAIERTQFGTHLKIRTKFLGPYKVIAGKGFDRYKVEKVGGHEGPRHTETSADKMKPWVEGEDEHFTDYEDEDTGEEAEQDSQVEEVPEGSKMKIDVE